MSWSAFVSKAYHIDNKVVTSKTPLPAPAKPIVSENIQALEVKTPESQLFQFPLEKYDVVFLESQAAIEKAIFKSYQNHSFPLKVGLLLGDMDVKFQRGKTSANTVEFVCRNKDKEIIKRFIFSNANYTIGLEINVQNLSNAPMNINLPLILGVVNLNGDQAEARLRDATFSTSDKIAHFNLHKDTTLEGVKFLGLRDRYFCAIIEPSERNYTGFIRNIGTHQSEVGLNIKEFVLPPGQNMLLKFAIYLGPQELRQITAVQPEWTAVMYYGTFDFIAHLLLQLLDFLFNLVHNWGIVIIILSILIYFMLYPLSLKQMRSMKKMQALQPRIEELRKIYKDNPQKLNAETMGLYREYKINPLSGCLPLILQMPIFFALYQVLIRSVAFKGAKFLWIKDLSLPDRLFILPTTIPLLGNEINLLPLLMTLGMFIQQKLSMSTSSTGSAEQQKIMMIVFPLMFGFIFYHMPSGLVLYWFINSALMLFYQLRMSRQK